MQGRIESIVEMVEVPGFIWCHAHGCVHETRVDPYEEGTNCREHWVRLYADRTDYDGEGALYCAWCGRVFVRPSNRGPAPLYCSAACRQKAHRARHEAAERITSQGFPT